MKGVHTSLLALVAALGCASGSGAGPKAGSDSGAEDARFPTPDALSELTERPAPPPQKVFGEAGLELETWDLQGPLPDQIGYVAHHYDDALGQILQAAVNKKPGAVLLSEAMHCVAREWGHFILAHGQNPSENLRRFIQGRCGALAANVGGSTLGGEVPDSATDEAIITRWQESFPQVVERGLGVGQRFAGMWWGRGHGRAIAIVVSGHRMLHLEPIPMQPAGNTVQLKGELYMSANEVSGAVTLGKYGVNSCRPDAAVQLPAFVLECEVGEEDDYAWLQVLAVPPGRILGKFVFSGLLRPTGAPVSTYQQPKWDAPVVAASDQEMIEILGGLINQVREHASLEPMALSLAESETATVLAPYYFAGILRVFDETVADTVALGIRAGWRIDDLVRYGNFTAGWLLGSDDLARLVATSLVMPYGRRTLLDPDARHLAVGPVPIPDGGGTAAIFSSYAVFETKAHDSLAVRVVERLNTLRKDAGVPEATHVREMDKDASEAASMMQRGAATVSEAADLLMRRGSNKLRASVRGWTFYTDSLDKIPFPDELITMPDADVTAAVAVLKPPGQAWAAYYIVVMVAEGRTVTI